MSPAVPIHHHEIPLQSINEFLLFAGQLIASKLSFSLIVDFFLSQIGFIANDVLGFEEKIVKNLRHDIFFLIEFLKMYIGGIRILKKFPYVIHEQPHQKTTRQAVKTMS